MRKYISKISIIILFILILVFLGAFLCLKNSRNFKTEIAVIDSVSDFINVDGIALRKETEIFNEQPGFLNFLLDDGDKVNKGGVVAEIYENEKDGLLQKDIKKLECEIRSLEKFENSKKSLSIDYNYVEKQSYNFFKNYAIDLNNEKYQDILKNKINILNLLNERQAVLGKSDNILQRLNNLKAEKDKIGASINQKCSNIIASEPGYFVGTIDGYENLIDFEKVKKLSSLDVNELLKKGPNKSNALAKIVNLSYWYFVCNISKEQALKFSVDDYVTLILPFSNVRKISAKVVAINQENKNADAALVLKCNNIDKNILNLRFENLKINIKDYKGLKIKKSAIHENIISKFVTKDDGRQEEIKKNVQGVYVLNGHQLSFKEVEILYVKDDYAICKNFTDEALSNSSDYLKPYDEIVVEGHNLYDKKIVK